MIRPLTLACAFFALVLASNFTLAQTEFSAEIFDNQKQESQAKVYFGKDKARFESSKKDAHGGGALIMNMATQSSTVIMDQQRMYMELPAQMAAQRNTYHFFRTGDVESACSDWLAQSWNKGGTCHKVGSDTVNGRSTVKYEGTNSRGEAGTVWLDPKLRFPVKWEGKNGGGELRNIQEGPQPASLFEIPSGYTKFDMGAMMKQQPQ
jgi:outer membrane lipoprotein-sorting protein